MIDAVGNPQSVLLMGGTSEIGLAVVEAFASDRPLRVVLTNYPDGQSEEVEVVNNPEDAAAGTRKVPFSQVVYIEQDDFMEEPPKKFFRLAPGREVRLRNAYLITCTEVVKDDAGQIVELRVTYDPETRGGAAADGRKVKATLHWVSAAHAVDGEVRLYDRLFNVEAPDAAAAEEGKELSDFLNPSSLEVIGAAKLEPGLASMPAGTRVQFERLGYFIVDADARPDRPVFNRIVSLKDTWARIAARDTI